jgi:phosphinothricin acetyltransferase
MGGRRLENVAVRPMTEEDWPAAAAIFADGIATGDATFETRVPDWEAFDAAHRPDLRLVAVEDGAVIGWTAAVPYSARDVYRGVAEESIYVDAASRGRGIGRVLLEAMIEASERAGIWTLQASVIPENAASLALHRAVGFRDVGTRERIGWHRGRWRDVVLLERRSALAGQDRDG